MAGLLGLSNRGSELLHLLAPFAQSTIDANNLLAKLTIIRHNRKTRLVNQGGDGLQGLLSRIMCCRGGRIPGHGQYTYANEPVEI